jgi:hypothetical protein
MRNALALLILLVPAQLFCAPSPTPRSGVQLCDSWGSQPCADGYFCATDNTCWKNDETPHCDSECSDGKTCCVSTCRDLSTDEKNCGACGHQCSYSQTCCSGTCIELTTNASNCGACGRACSTNQECYKSVCCLSGQVGQVCSACSDSSHPYFCGASTPSVGSSCWDGPTVCATVVKCGDDSYGCEDASDHYNCSKAKCVSGSVGASGTGTISLTINDKCNVDASIQYRFIDESASIYWPSSTTVYTLTYGNEMSHSLSCTIGDNLCYGARRSNGYYWGADIDDSSSCSNCCITCSEGATHNWNLTCN